jgi:hypothetical protein
MTIRSTIKTISPQQAEKILEGNDCNRPLSANQIASLSALMTAGKWTLNGQGIIISDTGRLLNGQHRLAACIHSGVPLTTLVVEGIADSTMSLIDTGAPRKARDIVGMNGHANPARVSAAAVQFWKVLSRAPFGQAFPAPSYALDILDRYPTLEKWTRRYTSNINLIRLISGATLIPALTYLEEVAKRPDLAEKLFDGLATGENLQEGDPVLTLRNRMISFRLQRGGATRRATQAQTRDIWPGMVKVIDALESGGSIHLLHLPQSRGFTLQPRQLAKHMMRETDLRRLTDLAPGLRTHAIQQLADRVGITARTQSTAEKKSKAA